MAGASVTTVRKELFDGEQNAHDRFALEITWVADDTAATVPDTALPEINGDITLFVTDPGSPAPTASYDITLEDAYGVDVAGGALADRSATASEQAMPLISATPVQRTVQGVLTFKLANNSVNSATGKCVVYIQQ
jgi:hypothetical protein